MSEDFREERLYHNFEQERPTQTFREPTQQDLENFEKFIPLLSDSYSILFVPYDWNTIPESREKRKDYFDDLQDEEKKIAQAALLSALETNTAQLIPALFFLGRETDLSLIEEVPENQKINMEIAVRFCRANELTKQAGLLVGNNENEVILDEDYERLLSFCADLVEELHELQKFDIIATHSTSAQARAGIEESGELWGAARPNLYLGEGVYAGVFGSYLTWNGSDESGKRKAVDDNTYRFTVPLSECTVLINNPISPRAMINIQYGSLKKQSISTLSEQKTTHKIPQAELLGNPYSEMNVYSQLNKTGFQLFRKLVKDLGLDFSLIANPRTKDKIHQNYDSEAKGQQHVVIETTEVPLVWATLANIVQLERITTVASVDEKFEDISA